MLEAAVGWVPGHITATKKRYKGVSGMVKMMCSTFFPGFQFVIFFWYCYIYIQLFCVYIIYIYVHEYIYIYICIYEYTHLYITAYVTINQNDVFRSTRVQPGPQTTTHRRPYRLAPRVMTTNMRYGHSAPGVSLGYGK